MTSDYIPHLCGRRLLPVHAARLHGRALCEAVAARRAAQEDCQSARGSPEGASRSRGPALPCRRPPHEVLACLIMCLLACRTLIVTAGRIANARRCPPRSTNGRRRTTALHWRQVSRRLSPGKHKTRVTAPCLLRPQCVELGSWSQVNVNKRNKTFQKTKPSDKRISILWLHALSSHHSDSTATQSPSLGSYFELSADSGD